MNKLFVPFISALVAEFMHFKLFSHSVKVELDKFSAPTDLHEERTNAGIFLLLLEMRNLLSKTITTTIHNFIQHICK